MEKTKRDPADFIASLPSEQKEPITALDKLIRKTLPNEKPVMWEGKFYAGTMQMMIGYGEVIIQGRTKGAKPVEWFLIGVAPQKEHITFYVTGVEDGQSLVKKYGAGLGKKVKVGSGSFTFKKLEDLDLDKLEEILKRAEKRPEILKP